MLKRISLLVTIAVITSPLLFAQITTSSLTGSITDASNAPLAGANIKATHQPTGTVYTSITSKGGQYTIQNMRAGGPYSIEISFVGFEKQQFEDIFLMLAEPFLLNSQMQKSVEVLENVILTTTQRKNLILNASRTGAVTNLSKSQIERLPTITRNINDLTRATPQSNGSSVAGGNYRQNNFTIDGSDFNNNFGIGTNLPAGGTPISLDALEEISVNITPFDVRQSGFIGSAINAITRSGTNSFSGSVYKYSRNEKQQGDRVNKTKFVRNPFSFRQWGFRVGGPIIKNKLFFFFNYETENSPKQVQTRFASTPALPFGPTNPNIARPTATELDEISDYLLKTYNYVTGPYDRYSTEIKRTKYLGRLDWNINKDHHLSIRYSQVEGGEPNPPSTSTGGSNFVDPSGYTNRQNVNAMWFKNSNYFQGANFYSFAGELTSKFGKKISNILRGTYTYQNDSRSTTSSYFPFVDILKDNSVFTSFGYEPFSYGNIRKVKMFSFFDNLHWSVNNHTFTFGIQYDRSQTINGFQRFGASYYVFNSWNDFISGAKPLNFALTYSFLPGFAQAFPSFEFAQSSVYAQDEIAINKNFRLTLGLRLDQPTYLDVKEIKTNPYILEKTFANGVKMNTGILPEKTILFSPRIGFNYDLYGNRSLQIRGGTGVFTGKIPFVWIVSQSGDNGMLQTTQGFNGTASTPGPFNADPTAYRPATTPIPGSVIPTTIEALTSNYKFPQTWKTSLGIDTKVFGNGIFTLEAIFNKDLKTAIFENVNLVSPQALNVAGYPDNRMIYPASTVSSSTNNSIKYINPVMSTPAANTSVFVPNGSVAPTGSSIQAANVISMKNGNRGYYLSLSAQLHKQFSKQFFASLSYTKSLAANLFNGGGDQPLSAWQGTEVSINPNVPELAYAGFVLPDRFSLNFSYKKEYIKHLATTFSLFYNGSIDYRFSYVYSGDFNRDGTGGNDLIYIPKDPSEIDFTSFTYPNGVTYTAQQQKDIFFNYINQDKYLKARKGQYAERNGAQAPWRNQVDIRIMQDAFINVGKNKNTIQFTLDIFNFGNLINPNWGKVRSVNASSLLVPTNATSGTIFTPGGTIRPTFRLQTDRNSPVTTTFRDNVSIASTYYMQFGLRYIFGN
jgi:hypothetical protein